MKRLTLTLITCIPILFAACQKKDDTPVQPGKINITLSYPQDGQVFHKGDTINIRAAISYISQLHAYGVSIKNKNTNEVVYDVYEHVSTDKFDINTSWTDTLSEAAALQLEVTIQIDHEGNESSKEVTLNSQP